MLQRGGGGKRGVPKTGTASYEGAELGGQYKDENSQEEFTR